MNVDAMDAGAIIVSALLSILWIALAVRDIRTQKLDNVATVSAFALAFGYRVGDGVSHSYFVSLGACIVVALMLYASNLMRGGDAKLLLSLLAWQPTVDTWTIVLACLALIGGAVIVYGRVRLWLRLCREQNNVSLWKLLGSGDASRRYPLGGVISVAGLVVLGTTYLQ